MDAIQLLTSGQAPSQRDAAGLGRSALKAGGPGATGANGEGQPGEGGAFAALLSRAQGDGQSIDPAQADGDPADAGASRLALTVGAGQQGQGFSLEEAARTAEAGAQAAAETEAEAEAAAQAAAEAARDALATAVPGLAGQQLAAQAAGQTAQDAAGQAAAQAAAQARQTAAGRGGDPAATTEDPGLLDAAAEDAAEAAEKSVERARKTAFEDFETAWRRLASSRRLDVDAATLKMKPSAGMDAQAQQARPVTAQIDGGASLLAKTDGVEMPNNQLQLGMDGTRASDRAGAADRPTPQSPQNASAQQSPATEQVAMQIRRAAAGGADRITLQLQPRDLGSVEIRLEFGDNNSVRAAVLVERPETLDLLQRDARQLQRALNEAGLDADGGSLSFDLRGQGNQDGSAEGNGHGDGNADEEGGESLPAGEAADGGTDGTVEVATYAMAIADGRLDIRI